MKKGIIPKNFQVWVVLSLFSSLILIVLLSLYQLPNSALTRTNEFFLPGIGLGVYVLICPL